MKRFLKKLYQALVFIGINPLRIIYLIKGLPSFFMDLYQFRIISKKFDSIKIRKLYPCIQDKYTGSGFFPKHYFFQDLYVAQLIYRKSPSRHVDIGSRVDGFVAHVAAYREIEVFDIRPLEKKIPNVIFSKIDIVSNETKYLEYTDSISALHVIEHIGLGRYGDDLDPDGHIKAIQNIYKILKPGGVFYMSLPIGPLRVEFNAHRVFSLDYINKLITNYFKIHSFSYIDDKENFFINVKLTKDLISNNCNCHFGCGIFELLKLEY